MTEVAPLQPLGAEASPELDIAGAARRLQAAKPDEAREAAEGFEAVFLNQFVDTMFSGMKTDGLFGGGNAEKMWQGFLVQHIADAFAARGGIGIADMVMAEINRISELPEDLPSPTETPGMNPDATTSENADHERER
ncbi:rod-binding protein [Parvularcula maris]|uniref:Rod-binding protein n=1 Tax=Parvularcula maris TaxID=2965077 RepID=A0A9X2RJ23_9PROT|nr:rod-binding protein [Parvularcula maris]MCQ8185506.1 rod-binding protein [Parvularcula maris]